MKSTEVCFADIVYLRLGSILCSAITHPALTIKDVYLNHCSIFWWQFAAFKYVCWHHAASSIGRVPQETPSSVPLSKVIIWVSQYQVSRRHMRVVPGTPSNLILTINMCVRLCHVAWGHLKHGKSEEFDSCDLNLNQIGFKSSIFLPLWPWNLMDDLEKTIRHLFYATSSFAHHFKSIGEFKPELQSWNSQFGSKLSFFLFLWPWNSMDDLVKQKDTFSILRQALCIISKPWVNSNQLQTGNSQFG